MRPWTVIWGILAVALAADAARAQLGPNFNHLECYSIKAAGNPPFVRQTVDVETQFAVHQAVLVKKPIRLCLPADKTGPGTDPLPPTEVPPFMCYKVKFRYRLKHDVRLTDQFGTIRERTSKPQLLCAPAVVTGLP